MYKYLILGASGFVGKHFIKLLKKKRQSFFQVGKKHGNLISTQTWSKLPKSKVVINLASKVFVPNSWSASNDFVSNNISITLNMMEYAKRNKSNVVQMSSYLYGNSKKIPTNENADIFLNNPYALSKYLSENICKFYYDNYKIKCNILRTFNLYGKNQNINFLIPSILEQINNKNIKVNDSRPKRDLLHIDDFINLLFKAANKFKNYQIYNVGYGKSFAIKDIINKIEVIKNKKFSLIVNKKKRKNEIFNTVADVKKVNKVFKWRAKIDLENGLRKILDQ